MKVVVAGWVGAGNLGDELIHRALVAKLRHLGASPHSVSRNPEATGAVHDVEAYTARDLRSALRGADGFVFGGGSLLQDETSPFNLPYHLGRIRRSRRAGVPFAVIGIGAGPLDRRGSRSLVRSSLNGAIALTTRDEASANLLAAIGIDAAVAADPALSLRPSNPVRHDRLVVSVRPPLSGGLLPVGWQRQSVDDEFLTAIATSVDETSARLGLHPHFVLMSPGQDGPVTRAVADRMRLVPTIAEPGLGTVIEELGSGRAMVAMRYHAAIGALLTNTPCAVLDYSTKMRALAEDAGDGFCLVPLTDPEALGWAVETASAGRESLPDALATLRVRERGNDRALGALLSSEPAHQDIQDLL